MISQIKTAFKQRIKEKTWLDNTTKARVIDKVSWWLTANLNTVMCI